MSSPISRSRPVSGRELRRRHGVNRTPGHGDVLDPEQFDGVGDALDRLPPEGGAVKPFLEQAVARVGTDHLPGDRHVFEPDGYVSCLAHQRNGALLGLDDRRPGMDADPGMSPVLSRALHVTLHDREAGSGSAAGGVLVRHREPEARQQPLVAALHDGAPELSDRLFARFLEVPQQTGLILRVECQVRIGLEDVAASDQHSQLAALGFAAGTPARGRRGVRSSGRRRCRGWLDRRLLRRRRCRRQHAAQVLGEVGGRRVPIPLAFRKRLEADPLQLWRNVADELPWRLGLVVAHLPDQLRDRRGSERHAAGEQFVEDHAQAVHVGATIDAMRPALRLFGRHVRRRPGDQALCAAARLRFAERKAEVDQHRRAFSREDDIRRLDVAVDDEPGVGVTQRVGSSGNDASGFRPRRSGVQQQSTKIRSIHVVRDDIHPPRVDADIVDRDDAGMAQLGEPARFLQRRVGISQRRCGSGAKHLDGHGPIELRVVAEVHFAEPAGPQRTPHLIASEGRRRYSGRCRTRGAPTLHRAIRT